jgi:hypothetical protein
MKYVILEIIILSEKIRLRRRKSMMLQMFLVKRKLLMTLNESVLIMPISSSGDEWILVLTYTFHNYHNKIGFTLMKISMILFY